MKSETVSKIRTTISIHEDVKVNEISVDQILQYLNILIKQPTTLSFT